MITFNYDDWEYDFFLKNYFSCFQCLVKYDICMCTHAV